MTKKGKTEAAFDDTVSEILTNAIRQYRHNTDDSPDSFESDEGFVFAYDQQTIDRGMAELRGFFSILRGIDQLIEKESEFVYSGRGNWKGMYISVKKLEAMLSASKEGK